VVPSGLYPQSQRRVGGVRVDGLGYRAGKSDTPILAELSCGVDDYARSYCFDISAAYFASTSVMKSLIGSAAF
jgi:hypothetical protein